MALSRRIARPLLASIFVAGGLDAVRNPGSKAKAAEAVTGPLSEYVAIIPNDPELLVRVNGAVQVGAGILLATGKFRRLASVALIGSIIPTTYAGHRFWEEADEAERARQRLHFLKNLGLLGGLLLAATDTEGEPSLSWRAKRRAHDVGTAVAVGRAVTSARAHGAVGDAARMSARTARRARRQAAANARHGQQAGAKGLEVARQAGDGAVAATRRAGATATSAAHDLSPVVISAARSGAELAGPYVATGADLASELLTKVGERLPVG